MALLDVDVNNSSIAYDNIRTGQSSTQVILHAGLENLWERYEPYADTDFRGEFAREPDSRFWEMYLTVQLLSAGKNVRPRSELLRKLQDRGPDIRIVEDGRTIWIEAVAPELGEAGHPDRVPEIIPLSAGGEFQPTPRRQVELRITSALEGKLRKFEDYREKGLVAKNDLCVVAVSDAHFSIQSVCNGLSPAATAVYPLGEKYLNFDRQTFELIDSGHFRSDTIERIGDTPIPRYAFLHKRYANLSGMIWSARGIGNFFFEQSHDFVFVHNFASNPWLSFPRQWFPWEEEDIAEAVGDQYKLTRIRALCSTS